MTIEHSERFPYLLDEIDEIMVGDDEQKLAELKDLLRILQGMSMEDIERAIASRKLRREVHESQQAELTNRLAANPVPTSEELSLGAFLENVEPQVRNAVRVFHSKGYGTASSGFGDFHYQTVIFDNDYFADLDPTVRQKLEAMGIKVSDHMLYFPVEKIDLDTIKSTWDAIAELLPDLGHPAPDSSVSSAQSFRQKYSRPKDVSIE